MDPAARHGPWADLCRPHFTPHDADFTIIGVPYDGEASARKGAAQAPERIRFWLQHLTPFSEDRTRLGTMRVCDLGDIRVTDQVSDFERIRNEIGALPNFPIVLGGDHSIAIPVLKDSAGASKTSGWACCGWTHTQTFAMSSTAQGIRMPA